MLEVAVADLWEYHRERDEAQKAREDDDKGKEAMETLSLAIAKVQFVQVYLEDSSIPLPVDDATEQAATAGAVVSLASPASVSPVPPEQTPIVPPISLTETSQPASPMKTITKDPLDSRPTSPPTRTLSPPSNLASTLSPRSRPHLTSSNFSWMLGEDSASSNFASGAAHSTFSSDEKRRMKGKGFLFGDDDDDEGGIKDGKRSSVSGKAGPKGGKNAKGKHMPADTDVEEEVIDLANMGKKSVI
jgi:TBC1 domain family protein 5